MKNVKVIALDDGTTFANNYLAKKSYPIAGMMLYGGDVEADSTSTTPVPVYLSNAGETVTDFYTSANVAEEQLLRMI